MDGADATAGFDSSEDAVGVPSESELEDIFSDIGLGDDLAGGSTGSDGSASGGVSDGDEVADSDSNTSDDGSSGSNTSDGDEVVGDVSEGEVLACSKITGADASSIKMTGKISSKKISSSDVLAIKLTGNKSDLDLNLSGASTIRGLCLFLAGSESKANIRISANLSKLVYIGRGNQSNTEIIVDEGGRIGSLAGDLNGNAASLKISGAGDFPCETVLKRNAKSSFQCGR